MGDRSDLLNVLLAEIIPPSTESSGHCVTAVAVRHFQHGLLGIQGFGESGDGTFPRIGLREEDHVLD